MVVDAPTAYSADRVYARFPALQMFKEKLADEFTIVLDDIMRVGENAALRQWASN